MANPKDLGSREVLLIEDNWRIVRSSYATGTLTPPYFEHFCDVSQPCDDNQEWVWYVPNYARLDQPHLDYQMVCSKCKQRPTDGMVVALRFLKADDDAKYT